MSVSKVHSGTSIGFDGHLIDVECDTSKGLPAVQIVGLANKSIDEAKERIKSALVNSHLDYPAKRITVNLAPAEIPKEGTHYDIPIALAILVSSGQLLRQNVDGCLFAGELALDGSVRPIKNAILLAETAKNHSIKKLFLPAANVSQATLVEDITIVGVSSLKELFLILKGEASPTITQQTAQKQKNPTTNTTYLDDIHGQEQAKRAIAIAAAGRHNILLNGSPGAGKTMLAKALRSLLPELSAPEKIAVTKLYSLAGITIDDIVNDRPFRSPHHTASRIALTGGGTNPKPGEISLAHLGVLFLDEIPEYSRTTLESLRQPLEDKIISISRANGRIAYPADFMLVATMNPCPCGYYGDTARECSCSMTQITAYQKRLSGPLLDRIDLHLTVPRAATDTLLQYESKSKKQHIDTKNLIDSALKIQQNRYNSSTMYNNNLSSSQIKEFAALSVAAKEMLDIASERLQLSARSYFKIIKVARTIADLEAQDTITEAHIAEALQYRMQPVT